MLPARSEIRAGNDLLERVAQARRTTDDLFAIVRPDSLYERPIAERHRIIFYIGHLEAFEWNLLRERLFAARPFHSDFDKLFAFGIDPVDGGLPSDQPQDWPSISEVRGYVRQVREALDANMDQFYSSANREREASLLLNVAIEHRLMHAETLAYMLHQLPFGRKLAPPRKPELVSGASAPGICEIPAGTSTLGLARDGNDFGWDNEFERHEVDVPAFSIDRYKVTNGQYLEFMAAGGYEDKSLWKDEDWSWRIAHNIAHPVFWHRSGNRWFYRSMFDETPLPLEWPVYVSHAEAGAYARWAGKALPTQEQWHRAAYGTRSEAERAYPWGKEAPNRKLGNFDFRQWDPAPVNASPEGQSAFGVSDLLGNGWEWTSTVFHPFAGFEPFPFYPGYSANFFDGRHYVMKGGSARTAACMLRRSFRNWFQPHYQFVYAGFRCVSN